MNRLLVLLAVVVVASVVITGCTRTNETSSPMLSDSPEQMAPAPPEAPPEPEVVEIRNDLFVHPPYRNLSKTYYTSASELADELRDKLSFGIAFADDKMTRVAKWNVGLIDNEARVWHMPDWPHKVRLEGRGDVFLFRARGFNSDGYLHWKVADDGLDLDFPCFAGGVTLIRTQYDPKNNDYNWYYDEKGYYCDYAFEGAETTKVIIKKKTLSGETTVKTMSREESWAWKVPWGADEDGHEVAFIMPKSFWASARMVPLPGVASNDGTTLNAGGSTVERTPDGAEYRYLRMSAGRVSELGIEPGKIVKLSDGRRAQVESVTLDRKPDSRVVKVKVLVEDQAKTVT